MNGPKRTLNRRPPAGPQVAVPGRLFGVRVWSLSVERDGAVRLGAHDSRWRADGESTWAECDQRRRIRHPKDASVPAANCTCGLYALHPSVGGRSSFLHLAISDLRVTGIVEAWGQVHIHAEGFRAQYARPVALALAGTPRRSDFGRLVEDVTIAHRAELLEVEDHEALLRHCEVRGFGMTRQAVEALLTRREPGSVRADGAKGAP